LGERLRRRDRPPRPDGDEGGNDVHRFPWLLLVAALTLSVVALSRCRERTCEHSPGDARGRRGALPSVEQRGLGNAHQRGHGRRRSSGGLPSPDTTARISPAAQWNGKHFCSLDWHVIAVAAIEGNPAGGTRTNQELLERLSLVDVRFTLDGAPLDTTTNAVRRGSLCRATLSLCVGYGPARQPTHSHGTDHLLHRRSRRRRPASD
jgi:hypothetical protein